MDLLTIGTFVRVSRLSAKALRRYDELGLLRPAHTDPFTGYRSCDEAQTERARICCCTSRSRGPYLLCSDGLFAAVPHADIRRTVESATDPDDAVAGLIALAHDTGAPDSVGCVVADVVEEAVLA